MKSIYRESVCIVVGYDALNINFGYCVHEMQNVDMMGVGGNGCTVAYVG